MTGPGQDPDRVAPDVQDLRARLASAEERRRLAENRAADERLRVEREIDMRDERIRELSAELLERRRERDRARRDLSALRSRRAVRAATAFSDKVRKPAGRVRQRARGLIASGRRTSFGVLVFGVPPGHHRLRASAAAGRALTERILAATPAGAPVDGPLVSIIILTRDGVDHLRRLLPALDRLTYRTFEVIVVDNGSSDDTTRYLRELQPTYDLRVVRNEENRSFSAGNAQGEAIARGELLLLLNNDTEPISTDFLGHMVETMLAADDIGLVGARLVFPRRSGRVTGPPTTAPDLTLQHRGTHFETLDGVVRARNLGMGEDPDSPAARAVRELAAVTAACALVRRSAWQAVGGLSEAYEYGMEDVDFCLALRAAGWRIMYDGRAVLWHDESRTRRQEESDARGQRQERNRAIFNGRWGPRLFREVVLDRLAGGHAWSEDPLHVGITVMRAEESAGFGEWYTAHELGSELERLGWRVTYLERFEDRWYEPPHDLDVVVVLLDVFDIRRLPPGVITVAWARNWIGRWMERPWFEDYDIVLTAGTRAKEAIERATSVTAQGHAPGDEPGALPSDGPGSR